MHNETLYDNSHGKVILYICQLLQNNYYVK